MKYNFETKYMTASTDSTAVAKRLILIIEDMEKLEEEKYAHDENGNRIPRAKSEFGAGDAYRVPNIKGEPNPATGPFKGAIVMPDPLDEPKKYIEPLKNRVKKDTPSMNITSRLHEEPADIEDDFVNHCVKQQAAEITKPAESKPKDIEDEEIEIDTVPADDEPQPEIPHGQKIKSEDIVPQEGTVEEAYLGEHFEIQPKDPDEKPLTPAEQELWDYIQANPNYTMQGACRALKITTANYYWRKRQLFLKGKPVGGSLPFAAKPKD